MKKLNITTGIWNSSQQGGVVYNIHINGETFASAREKDNATLICDAGNTYQRCGKLPSELEDENERLRLINIAIKNIDLIFKEWGNQRTLTTVWYLKKGHAIPIHFVGDDVREAKNENADEARSFHFSTGMTNSEYCKNSLTCRPDYTSGYISDDLLLKAGKIIEQSLKGTNS